MKKEEPMILKDLLRSFVQAVGWGAVLFLLYLWVFGRIMI